MLRDRIAWTTDRAERVAAQPDFELTTASPVQLNCGG
jgi:hypothetical protein